jgi:uncharacterized membrane protein
MTMAAVDVRLSSRHAFLLHAVVCVLFLSGALAAGYDLLALTGRDDLMPIWVKAWALMVHGGAAMLFLILFGSVLPVHVKRAWQAGRNRLSGSILIVAISVLIITGYGLYYIGHELSREVMQWIHLVLGCCDPLLFVTHLWLGRKTRPNTSL